MSKKTSIFYNVSDDLDIMIFLLFYEELELFFDRMLVGEPKSDFHWITLE